MLNKDVLVRVLPKKLKGSISDELVQEINSTFKDPEMAEMYRDNILGYTNILEEGRFKITQYLDAVRYVSFRLMGNNKTKAYIKAFPDRYAKKIANGTSEKDIASVITAYNKNKLVNLIYKQSMTPTHVINQDIFQEAINTQAAIMRDLDISPKVRSDAANSLISHLKPPEEAKIELDIKVKESEAMAELREATVALAQMQLQKAKEKVINANDIASADILKRDKKNE